MMYKKTILSIAILFLSCWFLLSGCSLIKNNVIDGTYFAFIDDSCNENDYIRIEGENWYDSNGLCGRLEKNGNNIVAYLSKNGIEEQYWYGTVIGAEIRYTYNGGTYYSKYKNIDFIVSSDVPIDPSNTNTNPNNSDNSKKENNNMLPLNEYSRINNVITFGEYPKSQVREESMISILNSKIDNLPSTSNKYEWTAYEYYLNGQKSEYMWYMDIVYNNSKYRGVYFTKHRPQSCLESNKTLYSVQKKNGYSINTVYWFKHEPLQWCVLKESNGNATLLANQVLDAQQFYHSLEEERFVDGKTVYPNNYAESDLRKWLNNDFYKTAFSERQKQIIMLTEIDNNFPNNVHSCKNTRDKVFILRDTEISTYLFGLFQTNRVFTDYSLCQGAFYHQSYLETGSSRWWNRTPDREYHKAYTIAVLECCLPSQ